MIPKGIMIIIFSTYFLTLACVIGVFFISRSWVRQQPEACDRLIRATWIISIAITIVFGGLAATAVTLIILRGVGFY